MVVDMPARRTAGAVVTIVSDTWVPGPQDRRALGVIVDDISLTPATGHFRPTLGVTVRAGLAFAACAAGVLLCGFRRRLALSFIAAITFAVVWLLLYDGAFVGAYVDRLLNIGIAVACTGATVAALRWRWPAVADLPEWATAVGLVLGVTAVKLAVFAHPMTTVGDAIFQVHRAQLVHAGTYFFTSVTPRPFFEFPYPIALYVTALPFWRFFPSELDLARLLRGLSVGADALIGVALYAAVRRQWNDRRTALLCALLWPFATAPLQALSNANLANAFGQSLFGVAMGVLGWNAAGKRPSIFASALAVAFFLAAFLSHFSTLSVGIPIVIAGAAFLFAAGRGSTRRFAARALAVVLIAAALSYVLYYSHFHAVYKATFARVVAGEGRAATRSIVAPPSVKFVRWVTGAADDYGLPGVPALVMCAVGAVLIAMRRSREPLTLILAGWLFVWAAFTALGILTPLAMRANLAVAPAFVCLAAYALGAINARWRGVGTVAAAAGAALIVWDGVKIALVCIGWLDPRWSTYVN
jgi:hypothetical protein